MSVVNDLHDRCFVLASGAIRELIVAFEAEVQRRPSLSELCELLSWGARTNADILLEGTPNQGIMVIGKATMAKQRLREGDLVCVPTGQGFYRALIYIGKFDRFGKAFGIFEGSFLPAKVSADNWIPHGFRPYPIATDDRLVASGRWVSSGQSTRSGRPLRAATAVPPSRRQPGRRVLRVLWTRRVGQRRNSQTHG